MEKRKEKTWELDLVSIRANRASALAMGTLKGGQRSNTNNNNQDIHIFLNLRSIEGLMDE